MRSAITIPAQIEAFLSDHDEPKQSEMRTLHALIQSVDPQTRLWYSDGKDDKGKIVANPTIGYGVLNMIYANGTSRESFRVGLSSNQSGISIYILGLTDKMALRNNFEASLGKATVTGYCVKFKTINDIDLAVLKEAISFGSGEIG